MIAASGSFQRRLFWAFAMVTAIAVSLPALFTYQTIHAERVDHAGKQAQAQALFAARLLETRPGEEQVRRLFETVGELSFRMTLLDAAGGVLRDSHVNDPDLLDNHSDRPEVQDALARGLGISLRHSNSLGIDAVYVAVPLKGGGIIRVAAPLADIRRDAQKKLSSLLFFVAGVAVFCLLLSMGISRRVRAAVDSMVEVVAAIPGGKAHSRLHEVPGREFLPLGHAINHMADTIEEYIRTTHDQQDQLESILESMHEGILVLSPSGKIRRWNRALAALLPSVTRAEGKALIEALPIPALQRRTDELLEGDSSFSRTGDQAVLFELPPGRFLVAHVSRPMPPGDFLGAVIVIYDATEIMRLERIRRDFVANVSHELRTPLTAIAGYAETLADSHDLREEYRHFAEIIHKHASVLARLVSDLLDLARIESMRETLVLTPTDAQPPLQDALSFCREQAASKDIRFTVSLEGIRVLADASLLAQVFRNLLENACRYSPQGGEVRIEARREFPDALFTVSDNGPGIPAESLSRIFERFYQVKKERNSGTAGIGLAICRHIIERHGGKIWAESPSNGAATAMLFTLPLAPSL